MDSAASGFSEEEIRFIQNNLQKDAGELVLKSGGAGQMDVKKLAGQILSRQKAARKLPQWIAEPRLIFPPALSVEQCSSEATARYKASLVSGETLTDITGGMGVDCFYMGAGFEKVFYFEKQPEVAETAAFNFQVLGAEHIEIRIADSVSELGNFVEHCDWLFADPARRDTNRNKVVLLSDCEPDIITILPTLFHTSPNILLKTSPLLDIDQAVRELGHVSEVHVVGFEQECKELLFVLKKTKPTAPVTIKARMIDAAGDVIQHFDFDRETEQQARVAFSKPENFLYEPHPAILKAGAFKSIGSTAGIKKLAVNSHLYTSAVLDRAFPGRAFEIVSVCKPDAQEIRKVTGSDKAHLTTRNFPAKTEDLRKKWKLKDGGDFYLFATTLADHSKVVIVTRKAS